MIEALLKNEILFIEPYVSISYKTFSFQSKFFKLHDLLPAILSCLLENRISREHWLLRDLAAKCCGQIIRYDLFSKREKLLFFFSFKENILPQPMVYSNV
jgi:hypothetical protein